MRVTTALLLVLVLLAGCDGILAGEKPSATRSAPGNAGSEPASPQTAREPTRQNAPRPSNGKPLKAILSIAKIGLRDLQVVPYSGRPDDGPGTVIQDRGVAASPHGPRGGTGAGGVGNYLVTAHRTSSTRAFGRLPELRRGHRVVVVAGGVRYVYAITHTRETSFRSVSSLRAQAAAVPGRPGRRATRAMITLSTCATPEDHAAGNFWADEFGNPEHRIDKIGVLVSTGPAR